MIVCVVIGGSLRMSQQAPVAPVMRRRQVRREVSADPQLILNALRILAGRGAPCSDCGRSRAHARAGWSGVRRSGNAAPSTRRRSSSARRAPRGAAASLPAAGPNGESIRSATWTPPSGGSSAASTSVPRECGRSWSRLRSMHCTSIRARGSYSADWTSGPEPTAVGHARSRDLRLGETDRRIAESEVRQPA